MRLTSLDIVGSVGGQANRLQLENKMSYLAGVNYRSDRNLLMTIKSCDDFLDTEAWKMIWKRRFGKVPRSKLFANRVQILVVKVSFRLHSL